MTTAFYDQLAPYYHLLYGDWEGAIDSQGDALARLLAEAGVATGAPVLDAACGIGTQSLGLLKNGYQVTASDISPGAIERIQHEFVQRGLQAKAYADDLRTLSHAESGSMAAVIACDNSLPHLLTDAEILQALQSCYRCLKPGGVAVFSVRDYAAIARVHPDVHPYGLRCEGGSRFLAVQVWEWDNDAYDLRIYLTSESSTGVCQTQVLKSRYYAVTIDRLLSLMAQAGFESVERRDQAFYQPVVMGRRPMQPGGTP